MSQLTTIYIQETEGIVTSVKQNLELYKIIVEVSSEKIAYEVCDSIAPPLGAFARICGDGEIKIPNNEDSNSDGFNYRKYLKPYLPKDGSKGWKFLALNINDFNIISDIEVFRLIRNITHGMEYYHGYLLQPNHYHNVRKYLTEISKNMISLQVKIQKSLLALDSNSKVGKTR